MIRIAGWIFVLLACLVNANLSFAIDSVANDPSSPTSPPFVAGFERFARHGDIETVAAGRLLLSELSCVACHASDDAWLKPKLGPRLERAGLQLNRQWIEQFLAEPHTVKPGTTMPNVLGGLDVLQKSTAIKSLAAYLVSLRKQYWEVKGSGALAVPHEFWDRGDAKVGRDLYHHIGCVACHEPDAKYQAVTQLDSPLNKLIDQLDPDELKEMGLTAEARRVLSIPHSDLKQKYTQQGMTLFLLEPSQFRASSRMPDLKLLPTEAADLAAYLLLDAEPAAPTEIVDEDNSIQLGREWFGKLHCNACHVSGANFVESEFQPLFDLNPSSEQGCLSRAADQTIDFSLDDDQIASIQAAIIAAKGNVKPTVADELQHTMLQMNCYACHERDGLGGVGRYRRPYFGTVGSIDLGDEGRLPPPLSGVGKKLQPAWFKKVLQGDKADIRPHLQIRMPKFHTEVAELIPSRMAQTDHASGVNEVAVFGSTMDLPELGRQLMDVGCVQCHVFGGFALPGVVGIDLKGVTSRVRPDWFHSFILDPGSLKSRTRMPTFFPQGKSQLPALLDGNVDRQVAAIWGYLKQFDAELLPEKINEARSQSYELKPTDRPILLRTFMPDAGTHAIAVGFPAGINFAFDAEHCRLAIAWRGRFLDAQGTWFVRSAPPADPLSDDRKTFPHAASFVVGDARPQPWPNSSDGFEFKGYRLDHNGTPTFLYRYGEINVADTIVPDGHRGLKRTFELSSRSSTPTRVWFPTSMVTWPAIPVNVPSVTVDASESARWEVQYSW